LFLGPVFVREAVTTPRKFRHYVVRAVYVTALMVLMCTAWLVVAGTQIIRNIGDMARFGAILFQILAPLQLALLAFLSALQTASAISQEKDRRTLILLLMTRMNNSELVLGKLFASLLNVFVMLAAALPLFLLITLFGGVSVMQVFRVFGVTLAACLIAASLGGLLAYWREKTFQTLAMTALALVLWIGVWEAVFAVWGATSEPLVAGFSPLRAILVASRPAIGSDAVADGAVLYMLLAAGAAVVLNLITITNVRRWNPSREVRHGQTDAEGVSGVAEVGASSPGGEAEEQARAGHVDARVRTQFAAGRRVWDNPILWREVCTRAYGRKVLMIRAAYLLLFVLVAVGLHGTMTAEASRPVSAIPSVVPATARSLAPFFLVSLVLVNALAVTSITNERDGQALDLLLVTDLSPKEFIFGKLGGVFWVTKEMVLLPLLLCMYLWWLGGLSLENLTYVIGGLAVMYLFVNMLGIHCGINYASSRSAIGVSLGVVFFLFLGVVTCMLIMISFSGSFQTQLTPFLAFILGGSAGLYLTLGHRNPSAAIQLASLLLPLATFYSITSFLLNHTLAVFLVTTITYGFATAAMMIPGVYEFDIAMGRTKTAGEE
jgi:ABC-type transport system involved in multi-copper enzyme maturation permease subunit